MNTRQHNYAQIAEKTKIAFQIFSKRLLAKKVIHILSQKKIKTIYSQPQIALESNEPLLSAINEVTSEQNEGFSKTMHTNHKQNLNGFTKDTSVTKITQLKYGDYVIIDIQILKEQCRIYSNLQSLKVFNIKEVPSNVFNLRKSAFQIQCPTLHFKQEGEKINSKSIICLKNVFTGYFVHLTTQISKSKQFGYEILLKPQLQSSGLFKFVQGEGERTNISTDLQASIASYYRPDLKISISQENLLGKLDRFLIGSYSQLYFKLTKLENSNNLSKNPLYYIKCMQINKNLQVQQPTLDRFTIKKQVRELYIQQNFVNDKSAIINIQENNYTKCQFFQFTPIRQSNIVRICPMKDLNLGQIWEIERIQEKEEQFQCRVKNVISNQQLGCNQFYRKNCLQFKKQQNEYIIVNEQNENLSAFYDNQTQSYMLKYKQQNILQNQSLINKMYNYKFAIIPLEQKYTDILYQLMQINQLLKYNYPFLQKWGFHSQDRIERIKYSLIYLKKDIRLMSKKIIEINLALDKLLLLLNKEENSLTNIQNMVKQLKLLEILIIYSQIIKIKIGKPSELYQKDIYKFASSYLKPTLLKLFDIIFLLTCHNQLCSQVIIQNNVIFNELLKDYSDSIGSIIEQAIKNLCILTNKKVEDEDVIFSWTAHVEQISDPQLFQIQKQYVDIIAQVVVDPNDIGIHPYQYKIKEQLIGNRKKKIIPKFGLSSEKTLGVNQPLIIFQYDSFPISLSQKENGFKALITAFQLRHLFENRKNMEDYKQQIAYIGSMLKLLRNLCKQRNKKLSKIMEDYGLTIEYMHCIFKNTQISWEIITKFLDLYCVMYLVQDPFLSFEKREVKCFSLNKISHFNFLEKTGIIFNQYTQQNTALQKHRIFEDNIEPIFDKYFEDLERWHQSELDNAKIQSFYNIVSIMYEIINYGYLSYKQIQRYVYFILKFSDHVLSKEHRKQKKEKIIKKVVPIFTIAEEISTIVQAMNLLQIIYSNFKTSKLTSNQYLRSIFTEALTYKSALQCKTATIMKRKTTFNFKQNKTASKKVTQRLQIKDYELDSCIMQYAVKKIVQNKCTINNKALKSLLNLLQIIRKRGQRMCNFLNQIFILDTQAESLYLQYSGIAPIQLAFDETSERRLLNVMKVKELVDKITEDNVQTQDQGRKKQKILQLKNLLMKIIKKLQLIQSRNYNSFKICQTLFRKLRLHSILIQIVKSSDKEYYQSLIHQIIVFLLLFIHNNQENILGMAPYFGLFTKKYSFSKLPQLLPPLFANNTNQQESFWLIYRNIDKKMDQNQKEILFQCIYNICKICSAQVLQNIKGQVIYNLITNVKFDDYVRGIIQSPNFIKIICFMGQGSFKITQRIKQSISKTILFQGLTNGSKGFILKSIYLKLYHFLYLSKSDQIDDLQCEQLVDKFFLAQLKHLPSSCYSRASTKLEQLKQVNILSGRRQSKTQIQAILSGYSKLMMEVSESSVSTSEQEHYFLFLLNINNQNQLSLLMCLKQMLAKYQIKNIEPLASYIFQLINFMQKIFLTKEKIYQSRILNKLYQISTIIQQKYNRSHKRQQKLSFNYANDKVWNFFQNFESLLSSENISYYKLLQFSKVSAHDIELFRNGQNSQKLILQSQFLLFINNLFTHINNRQKASQYISEAAIKQFFIIYCQKGTHKINIVKFLSKLIQILQNQKNRKICQVNKKSESKESQNEEKAEQDNINYELLKKELFHLSKVFQIHLQYFMVDRIRDKLQILFKSPQSASQSNPNPHSIIEIHIKNKQYLIMNLIVGQMTNQIKSTTHYDSIEQKNWEEYFVFLSNQLQEHPNCCIIDILSSIYQCIQHNNSIFTIFWQLIKKLTNKWNVLIKTEKMMQSKPIHSTTKSIYGLISKIMTNSFLKQDQAGEMQSILTNQFLFTFSMYLNNQNTYWAKQCQISLNMIINSFTQYSTISNLLSTSELFVNCFQKLLTKMLLNGVQNTNKQSQQAIKIMNTIMRLIKKFRSQQFIRELQPILVKLPYKMMIQAFDTNYSYIAQHKYPRLAECDQSFMCSVQFCNQNKITEHDKYILQVITNILFIIHIASNILVSSNRLKEVSSQHKEILLSYNQNKSTTNSLNYSHYSKHWKLIKSIDMNLHQQPFIFYFPLPFLNQIENNHIQKQVEEQLRSIDKQNYFQNLYHLSWYVQNQYEQMRMIENRLWWCKCIIFNSQIIHLFFAIYLGLINWDIIFMGLNVPSSLKYTINTIIILIKLMLFSLQCSRLYYQRRLLTQIKYDRNVKLSKYAQFTINFFVIIGYFMQYFIEGVYPLTFALQLLRIKMIKKVCAIIVAVAQSMFYFLLFLQSIIVSCSILIFTKLIENGNHSKLIQVYFYLIKELLLLQFLPIETNESLNFRYIKVVPQFIFILVPAVMCVQAVIIGKFLLQFVSLATKQKEKHEKCDICGLNKNQIQSKGTKYINHVTYEHNIWNYIEFFIYIRRKNDKEIEQIKFSELIKKQDFRFLKI